MLDYGGRCVTMLYQAVHQCGSVVTQLYQAVHQCGSVVTRLYQAVHHYLTRVAGV
jgi:hypothetical protein